MDPERIGILLSKLLSGEATLPEQKELESAFENDPALKETWTILQALKEAPPTGHSVEVEQELLEKGWHRLAIGRKDVPVTRRIPPYRWIAAASVLVLLAVGLLLYYGNKTGMQTTPTHPPASVMAKELVSKYGSRSFIELPDHSKLWLNAGSKVQYAAAFANGKRELTLSGEAFFDVKHDPAHPFIIHTGKLDIRVLGTTFNIRAYPGDSLTETTLIRGKVEVDFTNDSHAAIVLKPSEKLIVSTGVNVGASSGTVVVSAKEHLKIVTASVVRDPSDGTIDETSWVENKLVFRKEPFAQLALKLERWYNVRIVFDNEKYRMDELTGTFKDQRIDEVMHALQLTSDFHYKISGDTIHIW